MGPPEVWQRSFPVLGTGEDECVETGDETHPQRLTRGKKNTKDHPNKVLFGSIITLRDACSHLLQLGSSSREDGGHLSQHAWQPAVAQQPGAGHGHVGQDGAARSCLREARRVLSQGFSLGLLLQLQHHPLLGVSLQGYGAHILLQSGGPCHWTVLITEGCLLPYSPLRDGLLSLLGQPQSLLTKTGETNRTTGQVRSINETSDYMKHTIQLCYQSICSPTPYISTILIIITATDNTFLSLYLLQASIKTALQ